MTPEIAQPYIREVAIPRDELILSHGYANKKTLLQAARDAGLPVPKILTDDEAAGFLRKHKDESVFVRGYFSDPGEMWWVDILPTSSAPSMKDVVELRSRMFQRAITDTTDAYLMRNFNTRQKSAEFFLQQEDPGKYYFSTLEFGPYTYCVGHMEGFGRGVNWAAFHQDGHGVVSDWHFNRRIDDEMLRLSAKASDILNNSLERKHTRLAFKHDFLMDSRKLSFSLIQSRVASRVFTEDDARKQEEAISGYNKRGIPIIEIETYEVGKLANCSNGPYILCLTNYEHRGVGEYSEYMKLDLSQMVGLILPQYLRGGLLAHNGYRFIAYALYWGLPIAMTA